MNEVGTCDIITAMIKKYWHIYAASACFLILIIWVRIALPHFFALPANFTYSSNVRSFDNFYDTAKGAYSGENQSDTRFLYKVVSQSEDVLTVANTFDVRTLDGKPIFSVIRKYGIDRITVKHISNAGDHDRSGYLFAPKMKGLLAQIPDKGTFDYWHINYDTPAHMVYKSTEYLFGLNVYRYESDFVADQTKELSGVLPDVGKTKGIKLNVHLVIYVEPYTGKILQYNDDTYAYYYSLSNGDKLDPWNHFHNSTTQNSAAEQSKNIASEKTKMIIYEYFITIIFILLILILTSYTYINIFLKTKSGKYINNSILVSLIASIFLLLVAFVLAHAFNQLSNQQRYADFSASSESLTSAIERRLEVNADLLKGAKGLFNASKLVERSEWGKYVESLNLHVNYPAILGLGFGKIVSNKEKQSFIETNRNDGFSTFDLTPSGDRETYVPVYYIEPFNNTNKNALGFDMFYESNRRDAMVIARDSGDVSMTGEIFLKQDGNSTTNPAFIIYEPVYRPANSYATINDRREHIFGYVYAAIRVSNLMKAILARHDTDLGIEIYDGGDVDNLTSERLVYKNDKVEQSPSISSVSTMKFGGHEWAIRYSSNDPLYFDIYNNSLSLVVLIFGFILSLLISSILYVINTSRQRAVSYADKLTEDLRKINETLQKSKEDITIQMQETERINKTMVDRELKMIELKEKIKELENK